VTQRGTLAPAGPGPGFPGHPLTMPGHLHLSQSTRQGVGRGAWVTLSMSRLGDGVSPSPQPCSGLANTRSHPRCVTATQAMAARAEPPLSRLPPPAFPVHPGHARAAGSDPAFLSASGMIPRALRLIPLCCQSTQGGVAELEAPRGSRAGEAGTG